MLIWEENIGVYQFQVGECPLDTEEWMTKNFLNAG